MLEFFILFVIVKWKDWNSIVNIKGKTKTIIIKNKYVFQHSILNHSQVFDMAIFCMYTMLSIKSQIKNSSFWIYKVQYGIRITLF